MQFKVWTQKGKTWYMVLVWVVKVYDYVLCYIEYTCCYATSTKLGGLSIRKWPCDKRCPSLPISLKPLLL